MVEMAFGKKQKNPISHKLTQTHTIGVEGVLDVQADGVIFLELEEIGVVSLASILKDMDGMTINLSAKNQRTDNLDLDLDLSGDEEE